MTTAHQLDLFDVFSSASSPAVLREEARFGKWDARCGLPLRNGYTARLSGDRLAAYEAAYHEEIARLRALDEARV